MQRYGFTVGLRPERAEDYLRLHNGVWPQVEEILRSCNITNYTIFRHQDRLFGYYEYVGSDHAADLARVAAHPVTREWWKHTDPCQQRLPGTPDCEQWAPMEEVWHLERCPREQPGLSRRLVCGVPGGVTELGFGGAPIGGLYRAVTEDTAVATVEAAWQAGIRYFDTAPHYGLGLSEVRLGRALAGRPREEFVVSTKVGRLLRPNPRPSGSDLDVGGFAVPDDLHRIRDYSADGVRRSLEESLQRLCLDRLDIVYVHDPDEFGEEATAQALPALIAMREEGLVGAVGVGMNQWQAPMRMVRETDLDIVMIAGRWTLFDRTAAPLLQACQERGVAVAAAAPFNSGLLARDDPDDSARFNYAPVPDNVLRAVRELAWICRTHRTHLPHAALRFPLRHPSVATVVTGFSEPGQVWAAVEAMSAKLPEELFTEIDVKLGAGGAEVAWAG